METIDVELFGTDPKMQKAVNIAKNVAVTKAPVLIVGEAGVGKRTLGQFIHSNSSRRDAPIRAVDCSEDPKKVENSILGYRDEALGHFNKGALELANSGTVILANIDCLEDDFQKRLHRIFHELHDYDIDVRIIATTTKNLSKLVGAGSFYRGLYMFFSINIIAMTPLRERVHDLESLARYFIEKETLEDEPIVVEEDAMDKILKHYWTHNVYELKMVIENSIRNCKMGILTESDLEIGEKKTVGFVNEEGNEGIRLMSLKEAEKLLIKKALIHTSENRTQAAKILGVSIRTLRNKINEYRSSGSSYFVNLR